MKKESEKKTGKADVIYLNIAVMLFGLAGVVAQYIEIPSILIAAGRVISSSLFLFIILKMRKTDIRLDGRRDYYLIMFIGCVLAVHWTSFFHSVQVSTVAVGTMMSVTFPMFVTFIEPVVFKEKLKLKSVLASMILIFGVFITVPEFSLSNNMTRGILWGVLASLTYAVMTVGNRYFASKYEGMVICFYEQGTAAVVLLPALLTVKAEWHSADIALICIVGTVCTALAYTLYVTAQKRVKAQTAGIITGMETVYGILYALVLLGEVPSVREVAGCSVIIAVAFYTSVLNATGSNTAGE